MGLTFLGCLVKEKVQFFSMKTLSKSNDFPKAASEFLLLLFFVGIGDFLMRTRMHNSRL
jgi:hypothetical protein